MDLELICGYCNSSFTKKNKLVSHIKKFHLGSVSYACRVCEEDCGSSVKLQVHLSHGHNRYGQPSPECDACGAFFPTKADVRSHILQVHMQEQTLTKSNNSIYCIECCKSFKTKANYRRHLKWIHNLLYSCEICLEQFEKKFDMITHMRIKHRGRKQDLYKCETCNKTYISKANLTRHFKQNHGTRVKYLCKQCPKFYHFPSSLRRHVLDSHSGSTLSALLDSGAPVEPFNESKISNGSSQKEAKLILNTNTFLCDICQTTFKEESSLLIHLGKGHSSKALYEYCQNGHSEKKLFSNRGLLEQQEIFKPTEYEISCNYCEKQFTGQLGLNTHIEASHLQMKLKDIKSSTVNGAGRFKCPNCKRSYYSKRTLQNHMDLKHSTEIVLPVEATCEYCKAVCRNKHYLQLHVKRYHSTENNFQCDYCNKTFKLKRHIKVHIEDTHLGMRKYKCIECLVLCKRERSLRKHIRTKHPNSDTFAVCDICNLRFESAKSCKTHMRLLHSIVVQSYACSFCAATLTSKNELKIHNEMSHKDQFLKCEDLIGFVETSSGNNKIECLPYCILCTKRLSTRKSLKRHLKKLHKQFDPLALATYGSQNRDITVECDDCLKVFNDDKYSDLYEKHKDDSFRILFKCETCSRPFYCLEYGIMRYKITHNNADEQQVVSELCIANISDYSS